MISRKEILSKFLGLKTVDIKQSGDIFKDDGGGTWLVLRKEQVADYMFMDGSLIYGLNVQDE